MWLKLKSITLGQTGRARAGVTGIALALLAQRLLDKRQLYGIVAICFGLGIALYLLRAGRIAGQREIVKDQNVSVKWSNIQWALVLAAIAFFKLSDNAFTLVGAIAWACAVILCLRSFPALNNPQRRFSCKLHQERFVNGFQIPWSVLGLVVALGLGLFLRFYQLRELPIDLGWDLPYNYTSVQRIFAGQHLIFFPDNFGREGMFFYLIAFLAKQWGLTPYVIRVTSALVGLATLPAMYLLARECSNSRQAPVYTTLLLAINRWHISLSRSGYRVSLMPLFSILFLYGMARGLRRGRSRDWAWAGLFLGLGLWTYKAFVFAIPIAVTTILAYAIVAAVRAKISRPRQVTLWHRPPGEYAKGLAILLFVIAIVALPMIRLVIDEPDVYFARETQASKLLSESLNRGQLDTWQLYTANAITSLLMFNFEGDGNSRFGMPFQRELGLVSAALLLLGLAQAVYRWQHGSNLLLLIAFLGFMAPMTISMLAGEKPNLFRSSGLIGVTLILTSWVMQDLYQSISALVGRWGSRPWRIQFGDAGARTSAHQITLRLNLALLPTLVVGGMLWAETNESYYTYFVDYRRQAPDVGNYSVAYEMAQTMIAFEEGPTFIKVWPHWYDGRAVGVHLDVAKRAWTAELFEINERAFPLEGFEGKMLVVLHPEDRVSLEALYAFFPRRTAKVACYPNGAPAFLAFYGER